jgi:peptidyl-prolyl cis-trans isomerase SurA
MELIDRAERDTTEEVKRMQAVQAIRASKQEQETELWLRRLRDEAWVEIRRLRRRAMNPLPAIA